MDNRLIYFAKVNLNSSIFEVYEKKFSMDEVFAAIMQQVNEDEIFIKHDNYNENGIKNIKYKLQNVRKLENDLIVAKIIKTAPIFIKKYDKNQSMAITEAISNDEVIPFYYKVDNEIIAFSRTQRFGQVEFCNAFAHILNQCMTHRKESQKFQFLVSLIREGIDISEVL